MSNYEDGAVDIRARAQGFVRVRSIKFGGRRVVEVDAQGEDLAGALSPSDGHSIAAAARYSREQRLPLLIRLASSGANLQQGVAALDGWGGAALELTRCSGVIPTMVIVSGPTVSGPALMLGLADIVVMVSDSYAFVSGPAMVKQFTGVPVDGAELGGPDVHERISGVASFVAADMAEAESIMTDALRFLPDHTDAAPPTQPCSDPVSRSTPEAYEVLPASVNGSYDCREIIRSIVDDGDLCELHTLWAPNLVTAGSHRWVAGRSVLWQTNRRASPAHSTSLPLARAPASSPSVTLSTCLCSPLSTPQGSTRARILNGGE